MLGRFRMTVDDCLAEYKRMSHRIFRKPRWISQRNLGVPRPKYDACVLERTVEEVALRRCDNSTTGKFQSVKPLLPMTEYGGACQTYVNTTYDFVEKRLTQSQFCHHSTKDQKPYWCWLGKQVPLSNLQP